MGVDAKKKGGISATRRARATGPDVRLRLRDSEEYEKGLVHAAPIFFSHKILEVLSKTAARASRRPAARRQSQVTVRYVNGGKVVGATKVVVSPSTAKSNAKGKKYNSGMIKGDDRGARRSRCPGLDAQRPRFLRQPDRLSSAVPTAMRDRPQDHRRHLRRLRSARRQRPPAQAGSTKVDRSAAYAARYLAKNVVARGPRRPLPHRVAYAIGIAIDVALRRHPGHRQGRRAQVGEVLNDLPRRPTSARLSSTSRSTGAPRLRRPQAWGRRLLVGAHDLVAGSSGRSALSSPPC